MEFSGRQLTGISAIETSTSKPNPRSSSDGREGVLTFYCGPASDERQMVEIGENLAAKMDYRCVNGVMYFKTDQQTEVGTRATGNTAHEFMKNSESGIEFRYKAEPFIPRCCA